MDLTPEHLREVPERQCGDCEKMIPMVRGNWLWNSRDGFVGPRCMKCHYIRFRRSRKGSQRRRRAALKQAETVNKQLSKENAALRTRLERMSQEREQF